jgi:hypothetical protein
MSAGQNRLMALTKELSANWDHTKQYWNDAKSREFEKRFLNELLGGVHRAVADIDALERVLNKVRADCE